MKINDKDAKAFYGIVLGEGAFIELWKLPRAKAGYEYNWPNQNGMETDPDQVQVFDRIEYSLPLILLANDEADYWTKLNAFTAFLLNNRYITLEIPERNRKFKLVNKGISNYDEIIDSYRSAALLKWELANDYPTEVFNIV